MKLTASLFLLFLAIASRGQKIALFKDFDFDSTYTLVALSSSFSNPGVDDQEYCFYVNSVKTLNEMKKEWVVRKPISRISMEEHSISLFIMKNKIMVNSNLMIYPQQGIIHYGNTWYDFDMKKFKKIQADHPLKYHSERVDFEQYLSYVFFRDSVEETPDFLFLFEPTAKKFEGFFTVLCTKTADPDSPVFTLNDINKELKKQFPNENYNASIVMNDQFNLHSKDKVKIKIESTKALFEKYESKLGQKQDWSPYFFDTKVIFKD